MKSIIYKFIKGALPGCLMALAVHCGGGRGDAPLTPLEPLVTAQPRNQAVKAPATATFTASVSGNPAPTYQWTLNGLPIPGATSNAYTTPPTDSAMTGNAYALVATNSLGTATSAAAVLEVTGPPVITSQPANATVAPGAAATFTVAAAGLGGLTYQWQKGSTPIDGATGPTYTLPAVTRDMDGATHSVTVTNPTGSVTSLPATLTVAYGPVIRVQPVTQNVLSPAAATFTVEAEGNPLAYQWNRNGRPIPGATASSWAIPATLPAMDGDVYTVTVTCAGKAVTSDAALLNVTAAPVITTQPQGQSLAAGSAFTLSVAAVGVPNVFTYQWSRDDEPLNGATGATYHVDRATVDDAGKYAVTVSNGAGEPTRSRNAVVTVAAGYTVSGRVTAGDAGVTGATLTLGTHPARTASTDSTGAYAFPDVPPGTYTLTPSIPAFSSVFEPTARSVTVVSAPVEAPFTAALGYAVSGSLVDPNPDPATVYLTLRPAGGGSSLGTAHLELNGGSAFTFKGVPPGSYLLSGRKDLFDKGLPNAHDPAGTLSAEVTVTDANVTGLVLPLEAEAPDLSALPGPQFQANPMDSGVAIDYAPILSSGVEQPRSYRVEWSEDPTFATPGGFRQVPPSAGHLLLLTGTSFPNGAILHFRMRGLGTASATAWSTAPAVTVGGATGGFTASGQVTFGAGDPGPLYVGFRDPATRRVWMTLAEAASSPQAYAVTGLPASAPGAPYRMVAFLDPDRNGLISIDNPTGTRAAAVAGDTPGLDLALPTAPATATVTTRHTRGADASDQYTLIFTLRDGTHHVAAAQAVSGPKLPVPASLGTNAGGPVMTFEAAATGRPAVGDAYTLLATCHDGTTLTLTAPVTGVLDAFPTNLQPTEGDGTGQTANLQPAFSWVAPALPPAPFHYVFTLAGAGASWTVDGLSDTTLDWTLGDPNDPGNLPTGALAVRTPYAWTVAVVDGFGNSARTEAVYTP